MKDVLIVYWEATGDIARIVADKLHGWGYTTEIVSDKDYGKGTSASVVLPVVAGDCAKGFAFGDLPVVAVWPNNCAKPEGLSIEISELDINGLDKSLETVVSRFPAQMHEKASEILAAIKDPGDTRTIGDSHDTPLTDVLKKWPDAITLFNYKEFGRNEWKLIMCKVPQLASYCDWGKLANFDIVDILKERPELVSYCDFSNFEGWNWACLLRDHPELADACEWQKFTGEDWNCLYRDNPELVEKYEKHRDWSLTKGGEWAVLLCKRPEFADKCPWHELNGNNITKLLRKQPQFADKCDFSTMTGANWVDLLCEQPDLREYCKDWSVLNGKCWAALLEEWPIEEFEDVCEWCKLSGSDWATILCSEKLHLFSDDEVPEGVRDDMLARFKRIAGECVKYGDECDWTGLGGSRWAELLAHCPQLAKWCDWTRLGQKDWNKLLRARQEFKDRCVECGFKVQVDCGVPKAEQGLIEWDTDDGSGEHFLSIEDGDEEDGSEDDDGTGGCSVFSAKDLFK